MKKIKNSLCIIIACIVAMLAFCPARTYAAVAIDTDAECSLEISFTPEEYKASDVTFKLYKIADITKGANFVVTEKFINFEVTELLSEPCAESYSIIATTLAGEIAADKSIKPEKSAVTDKNGIAECTSLETGLYLVLGSVYHGGEYFYTPLNTLVSLPERVECDEWNYDIAINVKWEKKWDTDPINLKVLKIWSDSATNTHGSDSVTVELYKNDVLTDTQILSKNNDWTYTWKEIYGGANWSVKEKEVNGYTTAIEKKDGNFVITNTLIEVGGGDETLPQTGLLWWPVPALFGLGIIFLIIGFVRRHRD